MRLGSVGGFNAEMVIRRPTEEFALARVTLQERLVRLPERQQQILILHAAGYSLIGLADVFDYGSKQSAQYLFGQALKQIRDID